MTPPPTSTAILVIHGAYFLPPSWDDFIARLKDRNFTVECPRLPTCSDSKPPTATLADDVFVVRSAARSLIEAGHKILVLAHSYGGMVASEAITPDLYSSNKDEGHGIVSLVLLSAWLVQPNSSLHDVIAKYGFQCDVDLGSDDGGSTVYAKNAPESFYNDIARERAEKLTRDNVTHNWAAAGGGISGAPWKEIESVYVHLKQDLAIKLPLQESMVQEAVKAGGKIRPEELDSGHCPFLSRAEELVGIVVKAAGYVDSG
ncbi:hypothetical protein BDV06DRAFT_199300 [Aspergillus oleicola]